MKTTLTNIHAYISPSLGLVANASIEGEDSFFAGFTMDAIKECFVDINEYSLLKVSIAMYEAALKKLIDTGYKIRFIETEEGVVLKVDDIEFEGSVGFVGEALVREYNKKIHVFD